MEFESVRALRTLKLGDIVLQEGKVYYPPFSPAILKEVARGSPHLHAVERQETVEEPPEEAQTEKPEEVEKPKSTSRLIRRSEE